MERRDIPEDVQRFILVSVPSIPYLEAMLLIRNEPAHPWDKSRLAQHLYMGEKAAAELLQELQTAGVLVPHASRPDCFQYGPLSDELREMVDRLALEYSSNLIGVTNLVHAKTAKKAYLFADAFKWRKDS